MKNKHFSILLFLIASQFCFGQRLSFQLGSSTDFYFPENSNNEYNNNMETFSDLLGFNIAYTFTLDTIKKNELSFFMDLNRFNSGISFRDYPGGKDLPHNSIKITIKNSLSPNVGFLYGIPIYAKRKLNLYLFAGSSLRFNLFSFSNSGLSELKLDNGINYTIYNSLERNNGLSLSFNFSGQLRYKLNKGTNLIFTPMFSLGTFKWFTEKYAYEFIKDEEVIETGVNEMINRGSRVQLLVGFEFKL